LVAEWILFSRLRLNSSSSCDVLNI
jgi:hypothetical protein